MVFSRCFLCAAVLTLMAVSMETSSSGGQRSHSFDLSGQRLTDLYNSQVYNAERMRRPKGSNPSAVGPFSHSGVRVTLGDGSQWLIHKGDGYGISSQTVVTDAQHMSSAWEPISTRDFQGTKTVSDFVKAGGPNYNVLLDNCHLGSRRMMNQ
ncbi:uncharacterized protein LOC121641292 [Melanotaenia boesemani]|uniref:uncharacterized protein LOC121641292 n=1 Tax=Melanotaenia boesemani TaxID=1250792 RepID=UPI001C0596D2|nr:uncharacterized protein LOC121641292 [Melanotaenia boesemani]